MGSCEMIGVPSCKSNNGNSCRRIGDNSACSAVRLEAPETCRFRQSRQFTVSLPHDTEGFFFEMNWAAGFVCLQFLQIFVEKIESAMSMLHWRELSMRKDEGVRAATRASLAGRQHRVEQ